MASTEVSENHHRHHSNNQSQIRRIQKPNSPVTNPPPEQEHLACPRCDSTNTKFCYYNNYNFSQPRHFCKSCRRYWTHGGTLRDIPVGGGTRKSAKRSRFLPSSAIAGGNSSPIVFPGESAKPPTSFTSLLSSSGPGFLALNGFGLGLGLEDFAGFGLGGRGVWTAFNGAADPRLNGHGHGGATWQFDNGDPRLLVSSAAAANGVGIAGDFCSWNDSVISSPANVGFK